MQAPKALIRTLDKYAVTATTVGKSALHVGDIAKYAAAAGASLGLAGVADASVTFTIGDPQPVGIDLDGDAVDDVQLGGSFLSSRSSGTPYDFGFFAGDAQLGRASSGSLSAFLGTIGGLYGFGGARLNLGDPITAAMPFSASSAGWLNAVNVYAPYSTYYGIYSVTPSPVQTTAGNFAPTITSTGFVGVKLTGNRLGWIKLDLTEMPTSIFDPSRLPLGPDYRFANSITAADWYIAPAGQSVRAGIRPEPTVPAPGPLALLAAGAAGIAAFRRRKSIKQTSA